MAKLDLYLVSIDIITISFNIMGRSTGGCTKKNTKKRLQIDDFDKLVVETSLTISLEINTSCCFNDTVNNDHSNNNTDESKREIGQSEAGCCATNDAKQQVANDDRGLQPKRPMNAFMVWAQAIRRYLHQRFSNVQNASLSKALGRVWRTMDVASREPFIKRANTIKAKHKRDYPDYRYQPRRLQEHRPLVGVGKLYVTTRASPNQPREPMDCNITMINYQHATGPLPTKLVDNQLYQAATNHITEANYDSLNGSRYEQQQPLQAPGPTRTLESGDRLAVVDYVMNMQQEAIDKIRHDMTYVSSAYDDGQQQQQNCTCQQHQQQYLLYSDESIYVANSGHQVANRRAASGFGNNNYQAATGYLNQQQTCQQQQHYDYTSWNHSVATADPQQGNLSAKLHQKDGLPVATPNNNQSYQHHHHHHHHQTPVVSMSAQDCIWS